MDGCEEVAFGFVVACGDGSVLFEFGEEVFDEMAGLVEIPVVAAWRRPIGLGRDDGCLAGGGERVEDAFVGVVGPVGNQGLGLHVRQPVVGTDQIMSLPAAQDEADRVAQRIDQGMDLGAQAPARAADGLIVTRFLGAPARC